MAFNANTYRANKYGRMAWAELAEARAIKARLAAGTPIITDYPDRVGIFVSLARTSMRLSNSYRRQAAASKR